MTPDKDSLRGSVTFNISDEELIEPIDIDWEVTIGDDTIPSSEHRIRKPTRSEEPHGHS
jgi:hypothetical protein